MLSFELSKAFEQSYVQHMSCCISVVKSFKAPVSPWPLAWATCSHLHDRISIGSHQGAFPTIKTNNIALPTHATINVTHTAISPIIEGA